MKTWLSKSAKLKRLSSLILFAILSMMACKKIIDLNRNWSGLVTDSGSGSSIIGAKVVVKAAKVSSGVFNGALQPLGESFTNESGNYGFDYERAQFTALEITATKKNYFNYKAKIDVNLIANNKAFTHHFSMIPKAWIKVEINHAGTTPISFDYRNNSIYRNCEDCCNNTILQFSDDTVSFSETCVVQGNQYHRYYTIVTENGSTIETTDSIFTTIGDTALISLTY